MKQSLRLGVNIDHVATIRNARGGRHPDPVRAARLAEAAGADGITAHLREDRRHISDDDIARLVRELARPLNLEMAATEEMLAIALRHKPHAACLVPEKRAERTTEGGLDVRGGEHHLVGFVQELRAAGIRVSLFVEPDPAQLDAARKVGAQVVELHTGAYCEAAGSERERQLRRLRHAAAQAEALGLECHAGHGLTFDTVGPVAAIATIAELNIGHFLVGEAIFGGLDSAVRRMRALMDKARAESVGEEERMILGIGSDIIDIRRVERTLERFGERFTAAHLHGDRAEEVRSPRQPRRQLRQALRRQGGLLEGARHRLPRRRVLARSRRRQPALGQAHPGADRRGRRAPGRDHPAGHARPDRPHHHRRFSSSPGHRHHLGRARGALTSRPSGPCGVGCA